MKFTKGQRWATKHGTYEVLATIKSTQVPNLVEEVVVRFIPMETAEIWEEVTLVLDTRMFADCVSEGVRVKKTRRKK